VETAVDLTETVRTMATSETLRQVLGQNGLKMMRDNGGATEHHLQEIAAYL
jgi:hypothetical protein